MRVLFSSEQCSIERKDRDHYLYKDGLTVMRKSARDMEAELVKKAALLLDQHHAALKALEALRNDVKNDVSPTVRPVRYPLGASGMANAPAGAPKPIPIPETGTREKPGASARPGKAATGK